MQAPTVDSLPEPGIRFRFNERKAAAAAAFLLALEPQHRMPYMRLIKLLYLADRESLLRLGRPITGDRYVAMKLGPVLSKVLDLVKEDVASDGPWQRQVRRVSRYDVELAGEPETLALSDAEMELLEQASKLFGKFSQWHLSRITHMFGEWRDPEGSAFDIEPEDILQAANRSEEEIEEIRQEAAERLHFDEFFGD